MKDIRQELINKARELGICKDGFSHICHGDLDYLVDYYIANPDWCMERDYPTLPYMRDNLNKNYLADRGIFIDRHFDGELLNDKQVYIFHHCDGKIAVNLNVSLGLIPMLYFCNGCNLVIKDKKSYEGQRERIIVPIYEFGLNKIKARSGKWVSYNRYKEELISL